MNENEWQLVLVELTLIFVVRCRDSWRSSWHSAWWQSVPGAECLIHPWTFSAVSDSGSILGRFSSGSWHHPFHSLDRCDWNEIQTVQCQEREELNSDKTYFGYGDIFFFLWCPIMFREHGPGVTLLLLLEETDHLYLPRVKLVTESTPGVQEWTSVCDTVSMVPRGWDIEPKILMGPSPRPSWATLSHGHLHAGRPLCIPANINSQKHFLLVDQMLNFSLLRL